MNPTPHSLVDRSSPSPPVEAPERLAGRVRGRQAGPLLLVVAAIHGNEPAGAAAARRVLSRLASLQAALRGDVVALLGNRRALSRGVRYVDRDLNRGWTHERIEALRDSRPATSTRPAACAPLPPEAAAAEDAEQLELLQALDAARAEARGPVHFLDLHTTSADGIPFAMVGDSPAGRDFALHFPLPLVLGLLERVEAPLLESMRLQGCVTLGVEAGRSDSPSSVENHEAVLWLALAAAGMLRRGDVPELETHRARLARARRGLPHAMRVLRRHRIAPGDDFRMEPGFANIQRVRAGQLLARDTQGEIRAERDGILFMPLYQPQGDDGFFFGRAVHPLRLLAPAALRRLTSTGP